MQPLPREFLTEIAGEYNLSEEQKEVFVLLLSSNKSLEQVAGDIHISFNASRTRMTGVYQKFSIGGKGPNKLRQLHDFLLKQYESSCATTNIEINKNDIDIDTLVQTIRHKIRPDVQQRCSTMQVLDMTQPIGLGDIYTDVNILEKITGLRRFTLTELQEVYKLNIEEFDRLGWGKAQERISGLTAVQKYHKLMVWGKPGAGKTTFLKYIAIKCIDGEFQSRQIPLFIPLKEFAEISHQPDLLTYMIHKLGECGVSEMETQELLQQGKGLILLDGLDEVKQEDSSRIIQQIQQLANHPQYIQNHLIITCRIAAKEYTFQGFIEVEVADFNKHQIKTFVNNWFKKKDPIKADKLIEKLEENKPIHELATNPLLLTLLCLVFGEVGDLPKSRAELYEEGIDILLKKWDAKRNIEREQLYKNLSTKRKEDLLSQIALNTFKRGDYLFKQKTVEEFITKYIENLPDAKTDPEALRLDSEAVLRSIEAQHGLLVARAKGIYSFSHLTFQEYFTARKLVSRPSSEELQELVNHVTETRWREVFLLTVEMLDDATELVLLMKEKIDSLVVEDEKIQEFLTWLQEKASSVEVPYTLKERNALLKGLDLYVSINLTFIRTLYLSHELFFCFTFFTDPYLYFYLDLSLYIYLGKDFYPSRNRPLLANLPNSSFKTELQNLKYELPDDEDNCKKWWFTNCEQWRKKLRTLMIKYRNIGHNWQFNEEQKALLEQYYEANKLLMQCLNRECFVDKKVRFEIEDTLFLPIAEVEKK